MQLGTRGAWCVMPDDVTMEITFHNRHRLLVYFFCVAVVVAVSWAQGSGDFRCAGRTGFFPHPTSCAHFIACATWIQVTMSCPAGLHFNPSLKLCDWPQSAACVLPPATSQPSLYLAWKVLCPRHVSYYEFPDWTDCRRHYICIRGSVSKQKCPDGLYYDFLRWTCAYKQDVTCYDSV